MDADGEELGYEWEDVVEDDWDVLCTDGQQSVPERKGAIEFTLEGLEGPSRRQRVITKEDRQRAARGHRAHVLCLLGRVLLFDQAAGQPELQATVLSLVPPESSPKNQSAEDPQRAINGLLPLLKWFRSTFVLLPEALMEPDLLLERADTPSEQAMRSARGLAGTAECLVAVFAALIRALGGSARVVRLLDAVPLHPWRARPAAIRTLAGVHPAAGASSKGAAPRSNAAAGKGGSKRKAEALISAGAGARSSGGAAASSIPGGSKKARNGNRPATEPPDQQQHMEGGPRQSNKGEDEFERQLQMALLATQREAEAREQQQQHQQPQPAQRPQQEHDQGAASSGTGPGVARRHGLRDRIHELLHRGRSGGPGRSGRAGGSEVAGASAPGGAGPSSAAGAGAVLDAKGNALVNCWVEVYCGSADKGRWVHVDVVNGYMDRPDFIDAAVVRPLPVCYIVACESGRVRDVSKRYIQSMLTAQRNRDEQWWEQLAAVLHARQPTLPQTHVEYVDHDAAAAAAANAGGSGTAHGAERAPASAAAADSVEAANGGEAGPGPRSAAAQEQQQQQGAGRRQPRVIDARYSHQLSELENPGGPNAAALRKAKRAADDGAAAPSGPEACGNGPGGPQPGPRSAHGGSSVAAKQELRAAREDAELQHRALSQLQGLPTSIEGFKVHPLYILKRHIGKYEALQPGTSPLGLHRGEPYYPRSAVSVLHTPERWRREGREVRPSELSQPAKLVKKRAIGGGGRGGGRHVFGHFGGSPKGGRGSGAKRGAQAGGAYGADDDDDDVMEVADPTAEPGAGPTVKLYGRWQTDAWEAPIAVDGVVPKNDRGNVECPPLAASLPIGTVHLRLGPGLGQVCRQLQVDYAAALVGFEVQGGRMVPKIDGVVVCEEFGELVTSAYLEHEEARVAAVAARRRREAVLAWLKLVQAVRVRLQLEREYGAGGGPANAAVGGQHQGGRGRAGSAAGDVQTREPAGPSAADLVRQRLEEEQQQVDAGGAVEGVEVEEF